MTEDRKKIRIQSSRHLKKSLKKTVESSSLIPLAEKLFFKIQGPGSIFLRKIRYQKHIIKITKFKKIIKLCIIKYYHGMPKIKITTSGFSLKKSNQI